MENKTKLAAESLQNINASMAKFINGNLLTFDEAWEFLVSYRSYIDTPSLVNNAEELAHQNIDCLYSSAQELLLASATTMQIFEDSEERLSQIDFKTICNQHLQPFDKAWRSVSDEANKLWRESSAISNRLDYMDYSDPKFQALDKECDALRANYNTKKKKYEGLYAAYKAELERIAGLNYFDMALINIMAIRLHCMAENIIRDIDRIKKGGSV